MSSEKFLVVWVGSDQADGYKALNRAIQNAEFKTTAISSGEGLSNLLREGSERIVAACDRTTERDLRDLLVSVRRRSVPLFVFLEASGRRRRMRFETSGGVHVYYELAEGGDRLSDALRQVLRHADRNVASTDSSEATMPRRAPRFATTVADPSQGGRSLSASGEPRR